MASVEMTTGGNTVWEAEMTASGWGKMTDLQGSGDDGLAGAKGGGFAG